MGDHHADAAAVPVPDAGDDTLRREMADGIAATWHELACGSPPSCGQRNCEAGGSMPRSQALNLADALLPLIRDHVAAATAQLDRDINDRVNVLSKLREALYEGGQYDEHRARKARAIIHEWETGR